MKRWLAGAILTALGVICSGCEFSKLCGEVTYGQGQSADGVYGAKAHYIDCGAVGGFYLDVTLTRKSAWGYTSERDVLHVMGRFAASFEWPQSRLLRVTVICGQTGDCSDAETAIVRKAIASSDREWKDLKIEYAVR